MMLIKPSWLPDPNMALTHCTCAVAYWALVMACTLAVLAVWLDEVRYAASWQTLASFDAGAVAPVPLQVVATPPEVIGVPASGTAKNVDALLGTAVPGKLRV